MTFEEWLTGNSMTYTEILERMKDRKSGSPLMLMLRAAVVVEYLGKAPDPRHPTTTVCKLEGVTSKDLSPLFSYFLEAIYILWQE